MISALSVVMMLITYLSPLLVYTAPIFAGILLIVIVDEMGMKWAWGTFAAISLLSLFVIADKEAAVFYTMFFGYYPILKEFLAKKLRAGWLRLMLECVEFNLAIAAAILISAFVFHIDYSELYEKGKIFIAFYLFAMNVCFFGYNYLLTIVHRLYQEKIRKRVKKIFR